MPPQRRQAVRHDTTAYGMRATCCKCASKDKQHDLCRAYLGNLRTPIEHTGQIDHWHRQPYNLRRRRRYWPDIVGHHAHQQHPPKEAPMPRVRSCVLPPKVLPSHLFRHMLHDVIDLAVPPHPPPSPQAGRQHTLPLQYHPRALAVEGGERGTRNGHQAGTLERLA